MMTLLMNSEPRANAIAAMPDGTLAPLNSAFPNKTPHVDKAIACDSDKAADEGREAGIASANAVIQAGIVTATATNTAQGVLISVRVSVMDGTPLLLQQRLLELVGLEITGEKHAIMTRFPTACTPTKRTSLTRSSSWTRRRLGGSASHSRATPNSEVSTPSSACFPLSRARSAKRMADTPQTPQLGPLSMLHRPTRLRGP